VGGVGGAAALRDVAPFLIDVAAGVVSIVPPAMVARAVLARIRHVPGVRTVKDSAAAGSR